MNLFMNEPKDWKDLQLLTKQLFEEINCRCEVERNIRTARGETCVDVHVTDFVSSPPLIYLCECKYWTSKVPKSIVHSFRTILHDSGANRGYIISKAGFQRGALEAANHSSVELVTWEELQMLFNSRWLSALRHKIDLTAEQINDLLSYDGVKTPDGMSGDQMRDYMADLTFRVMGLWGASSFVHSGDPIKDFPWKLTDVKTTYNYLEEKRVISINSLREYFDYIIPLCEKVLVDARRISTEV